MQSVPVTWRYADFMFSLSEKVDGAVSVKYQLPGEDTDPDTLITLADDSDITVSHSLPCYFKPVIIINQYIKTLNSTVLPNNYSTLIAFYAELI